MTTSAEAAVLSVQWALQESYKIAVHNAGITDWSIVTNVRKREVEEDQLKIAVMLLGRL